MDLSYGAAGAEVPEGQAQQGGKPARISAHPANHAPARSAVTADKCDQVEPQLVTPFEPNSYEVRWIKYVFMIYVVMCPMQCIEMTG